MSMLRSGKDISKIFFLSVKEKDLSSIPDNRPYGDWTVVDLEKELKARGLEVCGSKAELVKRLEASDAANEAKVALLSSLPWQL
jgi:hypothetical protein